MDAERRVLVVGFERTELLDLASVISTLQMANWLAKRVIYRPELATLGGVPCRTASGLVLQADAALEKTIGPLDTLVVSGGIGYVAAMDDTRLLAHVRRLARESRRVTSVCTGSGVLAAAGLLDGHRAATHWAHWAYLAQRFPEVAFDPTPIYVTEGNLCTSAGVTAALDLTLSFIESDAGPELAREVARQLVVYMQRPGEQAQMSMFTASSVPGSTIVRNAVEHIDAHLAGDLSTTALAAALGVSERHLGRLFSREQGTSPARFVRHRRTAAAAGMLTATDSTLDVIAARCGFGTVESLRQAFQRVYGTAPSQYRASHLSASA